MENARKIWERLDLPKLTPQAPWFGYDLGGWNDDLDAQAKLAVKGESALTGMKIAQMRRSDVEMNTALSDVDPLEDK